MVLDGEDETVSSGNSSASKDGNKPIGVPEYDCGKHKRQVWNGAIPALARILRKWR